MTLNHSNFSHLRSPCLLRHFFKWRRFRRMKIWWTLESFASLMREWAMPCLCRTNGSLPNILIRRWSNWVSSSKHCKTFWQVEVRCLELLRKRFGLNTWGVQPWVTLMPKHFTCGTITFPVHRAPLQKLLWIGSSRLIAFPPMWQGWHPAKNCS